jgi:hypothetical protein
LNECLLTLIATPELEERLVDWLLEANYAGFMTAPCHGHGVHPERLSTAEQVAGQQRRTGFWLQLSQEQAESIVQGLAEHFGGAGLHFWITPVLAAGPIVTPPSVPTRGQD